MNESRRNIDRVMTSAVENKEVNAVSAAVDALNKLPWDEKHAKEIVQRYDDARKALQRLGMAFNTWVVKDKLPLDHVRHLSTHEASGLLVHSPSKKTFLLVRDDKTKKWTIPGGKGQGNESAWETAVREFDEETGHLIPDLDALRKTCLPSYYYPRGQYVLFFLDEARFRPKESPKGLARPCDAVNLRLFTLSTLPDDLHDFAKLLLSDPIVQQHILGGLARSSDA
jgi:8-oxo-dGTP pyrophosphatase MutT (NUDIX family)